jgi:hypothetical protein
MISPLPLGSLRSFALLFTLQTSFAQTPAVVDTAGEQVYPNGLSVSVLPNVPGGPTYPISSTAQDAGGTTSVRFRTDKSYKAANPTLPANSDYYERDRDLGQTFTVGEVGFTLRAVVVKTAYSVQPGAPGARVSLQLFEVGDKAAINDNGTTTEPVVGWTADPRADDYLTGETYRSLLVASGATLPASLTTSQYLRFALPDAATLTLKPHTSYAFLILLDERANQTGFSLANQYWGTYAGGHGIRREAKGTPPIPHNLDNATLPLDFRTRTRQAPGTRGFPDVCTWRDYVFFIEKR